MLLKAKPMLRQAELRLASFMHDQSNEPLNPREERMGLIVNYVAFVYLEGL